MNPHKTLKNPQFSDEEEEKSEICKKQSPNLTHKLKDKNYEWIYFNVEDRNYIFIRSIKDNMFQFESIVNRCQNQGENSFSSWHSNIDVKRFLLDADKEFSKDQQTCLDINENYFVSSQLIDDRKSEGHYVHILLVNSIALWMNYPFPWDIMAFLYKLSKEKKKNSSHSQNPKTKRCKHDTKKKLMILEKKEEEEHKEKKTIKENKQFV